MWSEVLAHWSDGSVPKSSQEEADTRILLHAKHASDQGYTSVIVVSEDTDVFVLLIAFAKRNTFFPLSEKGNFN